MVFAQLLDHLSTSVLAVNGNLQLVYMNHSAEELFSVSFRQVQGAPFAELGPGPKAMQSAMRRCLASQDPYTEHELRLDLLDRSITVDSTVCATPSNTLEGAALLIEMAQLDQRLRITHEEHLITQQQTLKALLRNLAHEIKNPLGGLRGAAQLLEHELPTKNLLEYTQVIIDEADRLSNLVDRMLGPNRPPRFAPVNIHRVIERVRSLMVAEASSQGRVTIEQDFDPSIPALQGDSEQLIQAVINIVRNALQALAAEGGQIVLRTRVRRQCLIGLTRHKLVLALEIADNGPGVPESLNEDIFVPTITGRADGTGLGLSIAQAVVAQHGGLIEYRSGPGDTVFTLLLPLNKEQENV